MEKITVNGINIFPFMSDEELIEYVSHHPSILVALNAGKLSRSSPEMIQIINNNIGYCDGRAAVLALKKKGLKRPIIAGCDLWISLISHFYKDKSFFLIGGSQDVIIDVVCKIQSEFSAINILGFRNGYFDSTGEKDLIEQISLLKPDIVFVAMGSPAQELLMSKLQSVNPNAIYQGLGGSFDVYSGRVPRAPLWIRNIRLEGVFRAITRFSDNNIRRRFFLDLKFYLMLMFGLIK